MEYSKKMVILVLIMVNAFIIAVLGLNYLDHPVSDTLIISFFAFVGGEMFTLGAIKVTKVKKGVDQ